MKVKDIISQLEKNMGRQPEGYLMRLINDGLLDIAAERQHKIDDMKMDLVQGKRWYEIDDKIIDITRVEVLDSNDRYAMIPKLADAHKILKEDEY
jgi:hypothetical protein|tara:strand:- start:300 stop:584 length:285 start_codon:yes stop_codon:yes gene_type:complete